jgi:hypothetical protein
MMKMTTMSRLHLVDNLQYDLYEHHAKLFDVVLMEV